jgi:hypothetical protein
VAAVSRFPEPNDELDWQPATSRPGELFTVEGRIRATGAAARNLANADPRLRRFQWSMVKTGLAVLGIGLAAIVLVAVVANLL